MLSLFQLAANETTSGSLFYLNSIFGTVGNVLGGSGPAIMGTMFKVFNTTVLALGSLIVTYTTIVSIILTAHEGEAMGKKFHSLWIPIRTVLGIAALVPTATGYSTLQIALMWFIIQGVGAADTLWTKTVAYVASGQSTAPAAPGASASVGLQLQMQQIFESLACQAADKAKYSSVNYCYNSPSSAFCKQSDSDMLNPINGPQVVNGVYEMGPSGSCGNITIGNPATPVGAAQNQALAQVIPTLGSLATQLMSADNSYAAFLNGPIVGSNPAPSWLNGYCSDKNIPATQCSPAGAFSGYPVPSAQTPANSTVTDLYWAYGLQPTAGGNFIALSSSIYTGIVGAAATPQGGGNSMASVQQTASDNGWIFAGGFFYYMAQANNTISTNVASINYQGPDVSQLSSNERTANTMATTIMNKLGTVGAAGGNMGISNSCGFGSYAGGGDSLCGAILGSWISNLSGSQGAGLSRNPILMAQSEGNDILNAVEIVIPILIAINLVSGIAGAIFPLGVGPWTAAALVLTMVLVPIAMFIIMIFLGLGVTLAVYVPMIPYMIFTFGALNWMIATIETMIAAPIVAIGLLHPEGGENLWGKAEAALNLLLNIFLRPSLMIFGLVAAMLMSYAMIMMLNYAFMNVVSMVSPGSNVIELIFFMIIYTSMFTTIMNKCFDLIHLIPDKILRWMGGGQEQFGEGGGVEKVGEAVKAGEQKLGQGLEGGVSGAQKTGRTVGKMAKAKGEKAAADSGKGGGAAGLGS